MTYIILIFSVVFAVFIRVFFLDIYKAPSHTMAPTVLKGDHIIANQAAFGFKPPFGEENYFKRTPNLGELVVYERERRSIIKRIMGMPGQTLELNNGVLSINSTACNYAPSDKSTNSHEYVYSVEKCANLPELTILLPADTSDLPLNLDSRVIPDGHYLAVSDNRVNDGTTQVWEVIRADEIVGRPMLVWLSYSSTQDFISDSKGFRWNRILTKLK